MRNVLEKIIVLQSSSKYIENVSVHIAPIRKTITTAAGSAIGGVLPLREKEYLSLKPYNSYKDSPIIQWGGDYYLNITYPATYGSLTRPTAYTMTIQLSHGAVEENLQKIVENTGGGILLYNTINQWSISFPSEINDLEAVSSAILKEYGNVRVSDDSVAVRGKNYMLFEEFSDYLQIHFVYYVPRESLFKSLLKFKTCLQEYWSLPS